MRALLPLIITDKLTETKRFYKEKLGFDIVFDLPTYLQLSHGQAGPQLAFMAPEEPFQLFKQGLAISFQVDNADEYHAQLGQLDALKLSKVEDKPWGWRSFLTEDPNGVMLDFYHEIEASPEMKELLDKAHATG
ncbi:MAG: VOC family protein [Acidobacteria bacterium]|nr:VOC family protein [Acidobacteriota bacterium]MCB9397542.1 VOC family protein [Acidobacteriota bacterium]